MKRTIKTLLCLFMVAAALLPVQSVLGAEQDDPEREETLRKVMALLKEGDTFLAVEFLNGSGEPNTVAQKYTDLVMDLYWKERAVPELVTMAQAAIHYCLTKALEVQGEDEELADELRSGAKTNAYNLASFTWPGWDQEGVVIRDEDMAAGLDAAKLNLRLAKELHKGALRESMAYWVLGAQYMAVGKNDLAEETFVLSREKAHESLDSLYELLASGYVGIAKMAGGQKKAEGKRELEEAIEGLSRFKTDDGRFCIDQLETAVKIFVKDDDQSR